MAPTLKPDDAPDRTRLVLYLGISGVLHPSKSLYMLVKGADPFQDGHEMYESSAILHKLLEGWPDVKIVLTSTRAWRYGMPQVLDELGEDLGARVIGDTFEDLTKRARFGKLQRHLSEEDYWREGKARIVAKHVSWLQPERWVVVDDEAYGWTDVELACQVVLTPGETGLLDPGAQAKLLALLAHNFGEPTRQSAERGEKWQSALPTDDPCQLTYDQLHMHQFRLEAAERAAAAEDRRTRVLALGTEGTMFTHVGTSLVPRPFLHHFLDSCAELFDRVVVFYDKEFRAAAGQLVQQGLVPSWFADVDSIAWDGRLKDLERVGAFDLNEVLLVEDTTRFLKPGQEERHLSVSTFNGAATDRDLLRVYELLEHVVEGGKDSAWATNWPLA